MSNLRHLPAVRSLDVRYSPGTRLDAHPHDWAQLVYASEGVMTVTTEQGAWVVPSNRAVWIVPGVEHRIQIAGTVRMRTLYFAPRVRCRPMERCCVVRVSPLLRELVLRVVERGVLYFGVKRDLRFLRVLTDELESSDEMALSLPMPTDARALAAAHEIQAAPGGAGSLDDVARAVGASRRTLERVYRQETGMTLGRWRQQARLLEALRRLAAGEAVTQVALAVGYDSPSAFIAMFRDALGTTPARYYMESAREPVTRG